MCNKNSLFSKYLRSFSAHTWCVHSFIRPHIYKIHQDMGTFWTYMAQPIALHRDKNVLKLELLILCNICCHMVLPEVENWYFI